VNNIRNFVASAGLTATRVPDSTRALTAYLYGATDYDNVTWEQVLKLIAGPIVQPFLNDVQTLASSPDDMVSYYSRALLGDFFQHDETLDEFRRIQTLCDFIYLIPLPLGVSAYAKSGNVDVAGYHVRSIAGGMLFGDQWVFFAFAINWTAGTTTDPATVDRFFAAISDSLSLVKASLSKD